MYSNNNSQNWTKTYISHTYPLNHIISFLLFHISTQIETTEKIQMKHHKSLLNQAFTNETKKCQNNLLLTQAYQIHLAVNFRPCNSSYENHKF